MKDKNYLYEMYNGTSTDDGKGDLETYENWLEKQLLSRIERLELLDLHIVNSRRELLIAYEIKTSNCSDEQAEIKVDSYMTNTTVSDL